jgi:hypothetical protein
MDYQEFTTAVRKAGLTPRRCDREVHWQIRDGSRQIVNVWPKTKAGFRFQADGQKSKLGTLDEAIELAGPRKRSVSVAPWEEPAAQVGLIRRFWRWLW